ncbi:hypothetical protein Dsin_010506 [Dipteronia sinensis]|uniref:Protein-tyrosine-phosphatase MKP1 C-terminal domain-containing protein n=1 Tax=Dipteronia sinensis TaxID=43782 RepID=A0AAE0ASL3_9ROSI|nr:hypothetical protein Dsin_010506 [Dipteronia sinensis]
MKDVDENQFVYEDDREDLTQLKTIGSKFLDQMGSPVNASVQIVREGKEPEQHLNHLNCFSFQKAKDSGDY